jgi:hypothetical protein
LSNGHLKLELSQEAIRNKEAMKAVPAEEKREKVRASKKEKSSTRMGLLLNIKQEENLELRVGIN